METVSFDDTLGELWQVVEEGLGDVEYGHLLAVFTLSIVGQTILVIYQNVWCPSLGV
jgi:hypothetical protein